MYLFDNESNSLVRVDKCSFKSLGLDERNNLQEWIAKEPSSLGEELLIIQKEFDGFSDTRERLDLLALDKRGNLVVISFSKTSKSLFNVRASCQIIIYSTVDKHPSSPKSAEAGWLR